MKYIFFSAFILFSSNVWSQLVTNIYWSDQSGLPVSEAIYYSQDKRLDWPDFKGAPNTGGNIAAITTSGFGYKASMKNNGSKGQLNIGIYCYFNKDKSWVKSNKKTDYILNHEQHHFDISFIAANLFADKLKNTSVTITNCNSLLPALYKECCDLMNKMQDDYDGQTKNGQVKEIQEKWDSFLNKKLATFIK
ncbi:MAG: hypothetical protein ABIT07_03060 [Ferruginibacter sp.]